MCWHDWGKWQDKERGSICRSFDGKKVGNWVLQEKRCKKCNKLKMRTVESE